MIETLNKLLAISGGQQSYNYNYDITYEDRTVTSPYTCTYQLSTNDPVEVSGTVGWIQANGGDIVSVTPTK